MNKFAEYAAAAKAAAAAEALAGMSPAEQAAARATARSWDDQPAALRAHSAPWALRDETGKWNFWNGVGPWPEWAVSPSRGRGRLWPGVAWLRQALQQASLPGGPRSEPAQGSTRQPIWASSTWRRRPRKKSTDLLQSYR